MATEIPRKVLEVAYHDWAQRYLRSLRMEDFMEGVSQATQRKITVESMDVVHVHRPDIQTFNELLIQAPRKGRRRPVQVCPDNLVVVCDTPIVAEGSFDVPLQPVGPFWVLEYVSKATRRKDVEVSLPKYEVDLKVPYFSMFTPDDRELVLYRHNGTKYVSVPPNEHGRYALPELEMEIGLLDGWMRFWFRGALVPLTPDLQRDLEQARQRADNEKRRADSAEQRANSAEQRAAAEKQRADNAEQHVRQLEDELRRLRAQLTSSQTPPPDAP
jgi:Uma2 family endonuclease